MASKAVLKGWEWPLLRWGLVLWWLSIAIYVAIPDYPYGTPIWVWATLDKNGFLHEEFYIATFFVALITLTYYWENLRRTKVILHAAVKRIEKGV